MKFPFSQKVKNHHVLAVLMGLFIIFPIQIPDLVASLVNNVLGKIVVIVTALYLLSVNAVVGSLGIVAAYLLIQRSSVNESVLVEQFVPSEFKKSEEMQKYNEAPITVEETVIKNQIPFSFNREIIHNSNIDPVSENIHSAQAV